MQKTVTKAEKLAEAGRKSWITRRENDLKRKRSEAGNKAAITRKANREARLQEEAKAEKAAAKVAKKPTAVKAKSTKTKAKAPTAKPKTSKAKRVVVAKKTEALPLTKNQLLKQTRSNAAKKSWATRRKNAKK